MHISNAPLKTSRPKLFKRLLVDNDFLLAYLRQISNHQETNVTMVDDFILIKNSKIYVSVQRNIVVG